MTIDPSNQRVIAYRPIRQQNELERAADRSILIASFWLLLLGLLAQVILSFVGITGNTVACILLGTFCACMIAARHGIRDPATIIGLGILAYAMIPEIVGSSDNRFLKQFGTAGASAIHLVVIYSFMASVALSIVLLPCRNRPTTTNDNFVAIATTAAPLGSLISIGLSLIYIAQNGAVWLGDLSYAQSFEARLAEGSGILLLSVPTAVAGLAFALSQNPKLLSRSVMISTAPFLLLLLAHGGRRYFLILAIVISSKYLFVRRVSNALLLLVGMLIGWFLFCYIGYLRVADVPIADALSFTHIGNFLGRLSQFAGGETTTLYATASAAFSGYIAPLPLMGDYLLSWIMAVPQSMGGNTFSPANVRFSFALNPEAALRGQGWGFAFWAEAYLVNSFAGVFVSCLAMVLFFRLLFVRAEDTAMIGLAGVICTASLYYALWFQRNSFAYFFKEFLVYQIVVIIILWTAAHVISRSRRRPRRTGVILVLSQNNLPRMGHHGS